jgi:hypothetical protein
MMLSPSAARLGTSIRLKGKAIPFRTYHALQSNRYGKGDQQSMLRTLHATTVQLSSHRRVSDITYDQHRFKSTACLADYDNEEPSSHPTKSLGLSYIGHAAAAEYRVQLQQQSTNDDHDAATIAAATPPPAMNESWRINLGRGNDNAWLMGPRNEQEWFTGMAPLNECPGMFIKFTYASESKDRVDQLAHSIILSNVTLNIVIAIMEYTIDCG